MTHDTRQHSAALRAVAGRLAGEMEAVFLTASTALFARIEDVGTISGLLQEVATANGKEGRANVEEAVQRVGTHLKQIEGQFDFLDQAAETLHSNAVEIRELLPKQGRTIRQARIIAINAQVISCTINEAKLSHFSTEVRAILDRSGEAVGTLGEELAHADKRLARLLPGLRNMKRTAQEIDELRRAIPGLLNGTRGDQLVGRALDRIGRAQKDLNAALQSAVTRLQCGDAVRQRLEHVATILTRGETGPPEVRDAALLLARLQFRAALDALGTDVEAALPEFDRMAAPAEQARAELASITEAPMTRSLAKMAETARHLFGRRGAARSAVQPDRARHGGAVGALRCDRNDGRAGVAA